MKRLFYTLGLLLAGTSAYAAPGDTTWVQAQNSIQLNNYGAFDIPVNFPSGSATYRKVLMTFTLGAYNCPPGTQYCHQWDYDVHNVLMTPGGDTVELSRFITPYANTGVPRFPSGWKHRYIFDVTDYATLLRGSNTFRIFYSGYSFGFTADVKFAFVEGTPERDVLGISKLWYVNRAFGNAANPISNYLTAQTRTAPAGTQEAQMKVLITGHGSDANGCCEFLPNSYTTKVNGAPVDTTLVWRDDCGWNDVYPQGGTWIYDRANWCPGAPVYPIYHPIPGVTGGSAYTAEMVFDPYTSAGNYGSYNIHANAIYYGPMNKATDASLEDIYEPTNYEGYFRSNPSDGKPRIKVRNTGSNAITSLEIHYGVKDSAVSTYTWTGSLAALQEDTLELPELPALKNLSLRNVPGLYQFEARLGNVNGAADQDSFNDTLRSAFNIARRWPAAIVVEMKTNSAGTGGVGMGVSETSWDIRNAAGTIVASRTNASLDSQYRDTVQLADLGQMHTFNMNDVGCDGLQWWVWTQNPQYGVTAGLLQIKDAATGAIIPLKATPAGGNYRSDFGCGFTEAFSIGTAPTSVQTVNSSGAAIQVYPNPATNLLTVSLEGKAQAGGLLELVDVTGRVVLQTRMANTSAQIQTGSLAPGAYQVRYTADKGATLVRRVMIVR